MSSGMLEKGIESQGATHKSYGLRGLRMWVSTVVRDMSKKDASHSGTDGVSAPKAVDSNTKRTRSA